jgi:EAL domain-containing protein (putative c-di-GMP-specific phosphodiesterase class I)
MYRAKSEPDKNICLFNAKMDQQSRDRLVLVNDLRQALSNDQFELAYQFQNDLNSNEPVGFEVLLRWNHPTQGRIPPSAFIPIAEETGLIREIGLWVLHTACFEAAQWTQPYSVAVNVAPQQLVQTSFLEHVSNILAESKLDPQRLELEITEASIIDDQAHTLKVYARFAKHGHPYRHG